MRVIAWFGVASSVACNAGASGWEKADVLPYLPPDSCFDAGHLAEVSPAALWRTASASYAVIDVDERSGALGVLPGEVIQVTLGEFDPDGGIAGCAAGIGTLTFQDGDSQLTRVRVSQVEGFEVVNVDVRFRLPEGARERYGLGASTPASMHLFAGVEWQEDGSTPLVARATVAEWVGDDQQGEWLHSSCESVGEPGCLSFPEAPAGAPVPW